MYSCRTSLQGSVLGRNSNRNGEAKIKERRKETEMDVETKGVRGDPMRCHKDVETKESMEHGTGSGNVTKRRYIKGGERRRKH